MKLSVETIPQPQKVFHLELTEQEAWSIMHVLGQLNGEDGPTTRIYEGLEQHFYARGNYNLRKKYGHVNIPGAPRWIHPDRQDD